MVHSYPAPSPFAGIDGKRIAGNVAVVALHVLVFALLMLPSSWSPGEEAPVPQPLPVVFEPVTPKPVEATEPPPPRPVQRERPPQPQTPPRVVEPESAPAVDGPVFPDGEQYVPPGDEAGPPIDSYEPASAAAVELALDVHPAPRYPRESLRRGEQGMVVLRVRVDAGGRPIEVSIERSSGFRELDRAARDTVAQRWRFQPAQRDGRAVEAWGLVPVRFSLP